MSGEQVQWALAVRQRTEEEMTKRQLEVSLLGKDLNTAVKWREITLRISQNERQILRAPLQHQTAVYPPSITNFVPLSKC